MADPEPASARPWRKRLADYREKLLQAALLGVPLAVLAKLNDFLSQRFFRQPWEAIWFLIPIGIALWVLRQTLATRQRFHPGGRLLAFLGVYVLLFSVAARTDFLDISRELTAFGTPASRRWLTPVSWGDWRYYIVPRNADRSEELIVVLLEPAAGRTLEDSRKELADLIVLAGRNGARGVALDVYFGQPSTIDALLCHAITTVGIPVFVGYSFERSHGVISEPGMPDTLQPCLPPDRLGHLAGFLDLDLVSRLTPLYFRGDRTRPTLGLRAASVLSQGADLRLPDDGLLRYIPPPVDAPVVTVQELRRDPRALNLLRNRFVMAGEPSDGDAFDTPFGRKPGVVIHAYVAHSLRQAHYFHRHSWWFSLAVTLVFCWWMTLWCANGAPVGRLVALAAGATLTIVAIAVVSTFTGPYWFDVIYPLTAVWVLLPLLIGLRRRSSAPRPAAPAPTTGEAAERS